MAKGFYISKVVGIVCGVVAVGAVATIIALSVVYSQEKAKNNDSNPPPVTETTPVPTVTGPTTAKPSNELWDKYRLPTNLVPIHYNVTLRPRLTPVSPGKYIFTGESSVEFLVNETTNLILIHSNKLSYSPVSNGPSARLTAVNGGTVPGIESVWLQNETQYLVVQLKGDLTKGNYYILETTFEGELSDDLGGFYRSEYIENGELKYVLFGTKLEPAMKATFDITLIHDLGTVALSNGKEIVCYLKNFIFSSPETTNITTDGENVLVTKFERTERMSTYLLAFIVSEFGFIQDNSDDLLVRIFARKPAIDAGQGDYALKKTGPILKFFENYYNSSYPLPKSDQIALPDFNAGAMENWGLITYRETNLLYDEEYSSNSNKQRIATIIGHELAHMWFGNLVTLRWWNDLWLNEGFASYVEYLGAHEAEPTWNVKDLIVLNDVHRVFAVDALASSHPLTSKEEDIQTPAQINELFDAISYSKTYLKAFAFENTVYTDLWTHLQMVRSTSQSLQKDICCSSKFLVPLLRPSVICWILSMFSSLRIHANLRSTVYCNAIAAGSAAEWQFAWDQFKNASIASEADKLRSALACTKEAWLLNRSQDATSTIIYIANNVVGQTLAWDFVRARWEYIFNQYGGGSFSFSNLINGVTERFSTEFELQQLKQFKVDNAEVGFGSGTLALDQSIERTVANIKWIAENKNNVLNWFIAESTS
uniref:Alanyl (membrane) aminopeptidase b, tandem duplicate 1 n=1 Tax=Acanthochromis polyacanthus TaxID=80966 RepID=A0A3Q1H4G4_9TELE